MGAAAVPIMAGAAVVGAGTGIFGAREARRGRKMAEREAGAQRQHQEKQISLYKIEQAALAQKEATAQRKVGEQQARLNRRRIKGGLFGDAENSGVVRTTLGA